MMSSLLSVLIVFKLMSGIYAANCGMLESIRGGDISYLQINPTILYETGSTALLVCQSGRIPNGNTISTCGFDGTWTPSLGTCSSSTGNNVCYELSVPDATVTYTQASFETPYQSGTIARLSCNLGFLPTGATTSTCDEGIWSPPLDSCKSIYGSTVEGSTTCSPLPPVANGQIVYLQSSLLTTYATGTVALLTCHLGYHSNDKTVSKCTNEGRWEPIGACLPIGSNNEESKCPEYSPIENGQISYDLISPRQVGTSALLLCHIGYIPSGATIVKCENYGKWSDTLGTCVSILNRASADSSLGCPALSIENGVVSYDLLLPRARGTKATLLCNIGYVLNGEKVLTCGNDGTWTPSIGICQIPGQLSSNTSAECSSIEVKNGFVFYDLINPRKSGTTATLTCNLGYISEGATLVTCNSNGLWSDSLGSCRSVIGK